MMKNKNEGTCGYGPGGKLGKTPGGTKGMPADKRTDDMLTLREFIKQEIAKLKEVDIMVTDPNDISTAKGKAGEGDRIIYNPKST
jgi:hypothetical protein